MQVVVASSWINYIARQGEDLAEIARHHNSTVQDIWESPRNAELRAHRVRPEAVQPGDSLQIPCFDDVTAPSGDDGWTPPRVEPPPESDLRSDWPYASAVEIAPQSVPMWHCPTGACTCHDDPKMREISTHNVFLHDTESRRMPGARCRILHNGLVLEAPSFADATGALLFEVSPQARTVLIEWAPAETPLDPSLPFRRRYELEIPNEIEEGVRQRLEHVGVSYAGTFEERIAAFQRAYGLVVDGSPVTVAGPLTTFHDKATLPPLNSRQALAPDVRTPRQGCVSAVADRDARFHISFRLLRGPGKFLAAARYALHVGGGRVVHGDTDEYGSLAYGDVMAGDYALWIDGTKVYVPAIPKDEVLRPLMVLNDG